MRHRTHVRFDWAMKRLLRQKANFVILEGFLSELLKDDITILEILDSESNKETEEDKYNRVDILVKDKRGRLIIIEIQNSYASDYFLRILYGISKVIVEHMKEGDRYSKVKKTISINIVYFDLGQGSDYVYHGFTSFRGLHNDDLLSLTGAQRQTFGESRIEDLYPEIYLLKVNQFDDNARDSLDEWLYFLKHSEIKSGFQARGLREASEVLQRANMPSSDRRSYQRFMEVLSDRASIAGTIEFEANWRAEIKAQIMAKEMAKEQAKVMAKEQAKVMAKEQAKVMAKEQAKVMAKEQAKVMAKEQAKEMTEERIKAMIINLLKLGTLTDEQIAQIGQVPLDFVKQLKAETTK